MSQHDPLTCQETLQQLNAYIDGDLDPQLCSQLEAHMQSCIECQIVYNTIKKTIQLCQSDSKEISLPPEIRQRLLVTLGLESDDDNAQ